MPTEAITCPQCGGTDPSSPDAQGIHRCAYCGTRYRLKAGRAVEERTAAGGDRRVVLALAGLGLLVGLGGAALAAAFIVRQEAPPPPAATGPALDLDLGRGATPAPDAHADVAAPAAKPPPTATFELHHTAKSVGDSFYVLGVITNTSPYPIGKPELHVILYDADGDEVGADNGFAEDDVVGPGDRTLIAALVSDAPPHDHFDTRLELREPLWRPTWAAGLEVAALPPTETRYGGWEFAGKVTNTGDQPAQFVQVHISGWDADDRLVGLASAYAAGKEALAPGGEARYKTSHSIWAARPVRFEVDVVGRVPR
jgi:hypothetical protein